VIGDGADADPALPRQKLLRGPAAALRVRPVGKGHQDELAATADPRVAGIQHSGDMLDAHAASPASLCHSTRAERRARNS